MTTNGTATSTSPARREHQPGTEPSAEINIVSQEYFKALKMPILRGRNFGPEDLPGEDRSRSVIVDETFVERYLAGRDPIGVNIDDTQRPPAKEGEVIPPLTIVGVVPRTRNEPPGENNVEQLNFVHMYFYAPQYVQEANTMVVRVVVRRSARAGACDQTRSAGARSASTDRRRPRRWRRTSRRVSARGV